jgi:teichuronic acid exporter
MEEKRKIFSKGVFYVSIARYSGILISIIIGSILARLLTPEEFGIVAIVTVFIVFFNLLSEFGIGPAVIQNKQLSEKNVQAIFTFSLIIGLLLATTFFLFAPSIATFYNEPELKSICRWLSVIVLVQSMRVVPNALLQKNHQFKFLSIITVTIQLSSGIIAILLAYWGFSYYALVIRSIVASVSSFIIFFVFAPIRMKVYLDFESLKKIYAFSSFQFMFNFINYFTRNADKLLIGKFLSTASLGYYEKAYTLMLLPVGSLTDVITPVLFPILSNYQHDKKYVFDIFCKTVRVLAFIGFPLSVFLYYSSSELIYFVFGKQWTDSIPVFRILSLTVGIQIVFSSSGSIYQSLNRTDLLFYSGLLGSFIMVGSISYGVFVGETIEAVAEFLAYAFWSGFILGPIFLVKIAMGASLLQFYRIFINPFLVCAIMAITLAVVATLNISSSLIILALNLSFLIISIFILFKTHRETWELMIDLLKKLIHK